MPSATARFTSLPIPLPGFWSRRYGSADLARRPTVTADHGLNQTQLLVVGKIRFLKRGGQGQDELMAPNTLRHGAQREDYLHPSPVSQPERWEHRRSSRLNPARGLEHLFAHLACPLQNQNRSPLPQASPGADRPKLRNWLADRYQMPQPVRRGRAQVTAN